MLRGISSLQDFEQLPDILFQLKSLYVAITRARNNLRIADFSTKGESMRVCLLHLSFFFLRTINSRNFGLAAVRYKTASLAMKFQILRHLPRSMIGERER